MLGGGVRSVQVSFAKDGVNELAGLVADGLGVPAAEVAPADDGKPSFRPAEGLATGARWAPKLG